MTDFMRNINMEEDMAEDRHLLNLISREKIEPEPGFELGLKIKFRKCTKTQIIRFIFTNNLI